MPSDGTDYQSLPNAVVALLPTPAVNDMGAAYTPETWDEWTATMKAKHNNGNGHGPSLNVEVQRMLLPTPSVADSTGGHERRGGERGEELLLKGIVRAVAEDALLPTAKATNNENRQSEDRYGPNLGMALGTTPGYEDRLGEWGEYEPAIRRWEALTRPAPPPTKLNAKGNPKLSDEFDEWFMGYPAGWITDVPGVTWNETLKACGNGVMPQQGAEALRFLLTRIGDAA